MNNQYLRWQMDDGVGVLTLTRPPLNVLNIAVLRELRAALDRAAREEQMRALVLRAEGRLFSAGVDVADHTADKVGEMIPLFDQACAQLAGFSAPTLAVVRGHALGGGCELALCCDLVVAAEDANFGQPEIKLATFPPIAALRMPGSIGYRRTAELLLTGDTINAVEAARIGLINRAVPAAELDQAVGEIVGKLSALSASALRLCKQAVRLGAASESPPGGWDKLAELESLYLSDLMSTEDAHEGLAAFLEKRAPAWKHR